MHILCRNFFIALIDKDSENFILHFDMFGHNETRCSKTLYANRLISNGSKEFDIVESEDSLNIKTQPLRQPNVTVDSEKLYDLSNNLKYKKDAKSRFSECAV